jgi:hypothetical protein
MYTKTFINSIAAVLVTLVGYSQQTAFTTSGQKIILFSNGTWVNADSIPSLTGGINSPRNLRDEFNIAYKFAYDELFKDVFFDDDRKNKAANWAFNCFSTQLYFFAGSKTLSSWYDDMYYIGSTYFYFKVFFDNDRQKQTSEWVKDWMDKRTIFDPAYYTTYLSRFKEAYGIAYNKVYQNEFTDASRRSKAMAWAASLVKDK